MREAIRLSGVVDRAARVAYAFLIMNYSAVAALGAVLFRRNLWR